MHAHVLEEIVPFLVRASNKMNTTANTASGSGSCVKKKELTILDVGCGSGYLTAALARMVHHHGPPIPPLAIGTVHAIDVQPALVNLTLANLNCADSDLLTSRTIGSVSLGDGWRGLPEYAPYDAIHVGAAADSFPTNLMEQLVVGGVMVVPVGPVGGVQNLYRVERVGCDGDDDGGSGGGGYRKEDFEIVELFGVRYVPLVHPKSSASS